MSIVTICLGQSQFPGGGVFTGTLPFPINANVCIPDGVVGHFPQGTVFPRNYCGPTTVGCQGCIFNGHEDHTGGCGCEC